MKEIVSVQNEIVKSWVKLKDKKTRDLLGMFLIEGKHLVDEAIKSKVVKDIIVLEGYEHLCNANYVVSRKVMEKIKSQITVPEVCAVCYKKKEDVILGNVLILDDLLDPGNLGTIIRSAVAFNMPNIILSTNSVDLYNPKVIRSSEGMIFKINIIRGDLEEVFTKYLQDYQIYGTDVVTGINIKDSNFVPNKTAIIIGNEGHGMSTIAKKYCKNYLYIPMNKKCESLNASVSASILMYELNNK